MIFQQVYVILPRKLPVSCMQQKIVGKLKLTKKSSLDLKIITKHNNHFLCKMRFYIFRLLEEKNLRKRKKVLEKAFLSKKASGFYQLNSKSDFFFRILVTKLYRKLGA